MSQLLRRTLPAVSLFRLQKAVVLLALLSFAGRKRWLGWFFVAFTAVILLGSVHLAWHYAIDGYAGVVVALAAWFVAGRLARWNPADREFVSRRPGAGQDTRSL